MARIRMIKPEFWVSDQIVDLTPLARLTFIGTWNFADDAGNMPASAKRLKSQIFPSDEITVSQISDCVNQMIASELMVQYTGSDGKEYWHITGWTKHQKTEKPSYKYPKMEPGQSSTIRRTVDEHSANSSRIVSEQSEDSSRTVGEHSANATPRIKKGCREEIEDRERGGANSAPAHEEDFFLKNETSEDQAAPGPEIQAPPEPLTPEQVVRKWGGNNLEELATIAASAGFTADHGTVRDEIVKFCGHYGYKAAPDLCEKFKADPVSFFRALFKSWLIDSVRHFNKPRGSSGEYRQRPPRAPDHSRRTGPAPLSSIITTAKP